MNATSARYKDFGSRLFRFVRVHAFHSQTDRLILTARPCLCIAVAR